MYGSKVEYVVVGCSLALNQSQLVFRSALDQLWQPGDDFPFKSLLSFRVCPLGIYRKTTTRPRYGRVNCPCMLGLLTRSHDMVVCPPRVIQSQICTAV